MAILAMTVHGRDTRATPRGMADLPRSIGVLAMMDHRGAHEFQ
jgi:hypothetical protein